jgi:hypothetical protein
VTRHPLFALLAATALAAPPAAAQAGIAVRGSTLGLGAELSWRASPTLGLRGGLNHFSFTRTETIEEILYDIEPRLQSGTATLDLHPFGNAFHLSGGLVLNRNEGRLVATLTGPVTIGNQTYQPSEVGSLTGLVDYQTRVAPYLGLGFSGRGRVSFLFDVGVIFSGHPRVGLTGTTSLTGQAKVVFEENVQREIAAVQAEIDGEKYLKYWPVVSLGIRIGL